ncbi:histidine kinase [Sphingobacterium faecium]|uniref:sensor histidine kinase n=1 Tax=Sphingobacterium faecium TaxID=34087 RepID=UPI0021B6D023|nr:sensor histidine kinase [Sphingobacterium faecium]UXD71150.1 histidine kinase [Sphingobacterium faecium]
MRDFLRKIEKNKYFLTFVLLFAYAQSIQTRIRIRGEINVYIFTPEAAIMTCVAASLLFLIIKFYIRNWQKSSVFSLSEVIKIFSASLLSYVLLIKALGYVIALLFDTVQRNFNSKTLAISTFSDFMDGIIFGSFFLAYYYYSKNKNHQQELSMYHQALLESRISQLKAQLNPHFLFNNLNILDQFIEEDQQKASSFLNEFAEIYRYVLHASDRKIVTIHEELIFAEQYFKLIQYKYGNAYQLNIKTISSVGYILPLTLQLLIENAVQHNIGTEENPVIITIEITTICTVSNTLIPKQSMKSRSGRALNNLKEQYKLLTNKPIEIQKSESDFSIFIPVIYTL